ncbi:hypothetical protein K402DRAFT_389382 [Aulographum hederae CBS 113979]|uniref:RNase III domain-containing protein n=1 Tax=Aulographum hederae CBS 113979 TaxID=1176131 RepID=A0A6G1HDR4_9PEZI|nr:hypothetical protein K402DRAFT_389382 [Aulographum hederae CBS 113979]
MASKRAVSTLPTALSTSHPLRTAVPSRLSSCSFSASSSTSYEILPELEEKPRWQQTPPAMVMPVRTRPRPYNNEFKVNNDPHQLDTVYTKILGYGGDKMLGDEVKWLAVTHKSFDHGRRGFNDRLAILGKRIVDVQTSIALLAVPQVPSSTKTPTPDEYGRIPYHHPALETLSKLTLESKTEALNKHRLARLADSYGLGRVIRWKPKQAHNLQGSGIESVMASTMYAIVGAVAMERGGRQANQVTREKILSPLGLI